MMISSKKVLSAAWDVWRTKRGGTRTISLKQQERLQSLIEFARSNSRFYQRLYQHLPQQIDKLTDLPPVTKRELMAHFDDWVTDPQVKHDAVNAYIADPSLISMPYLGRYAVWRTSGTTGSPGVFLHDADAMAVYLALTSIRGSLSWINISKGIVADVSESLARCLYIRNRWTFRWHYICDDVPSTASRFRDKTTHFLRTYGII